MRNCQFCHTELLEDARFCHHCGAKVRLQNISCPECQHSNPKEAQFCASCGYEFFSTYDSSAVYEPIYPLNFRKVKGLASEIRQYFIQALDRRIKETQDPKQMKHYMNRLMQSEFNAIFELRTNQLAEDAYTIHTTQTPTVQQEVDKLLINAFDGLLDYFIFKYCRDINLSNISDEALKYEGLERDAFDMQVMVMDFLDLQDEEITVYTDFIKMPLKKLQNASRNFLFPAKHEKVLLIADQTIFGSCREGFALTEDALYWKAHFKDAAKVYYHDIDSIKREKEWLLINEHFFNVNPSVNGKMMYLLKRLKRIS